MSFPVLYILSEEIENNGVVGSLPNRAKHAMYIVTEKNGEKNRSAIYKREIAGSDQAIIEPTQESLRWMILSGWDWDGPSGAQDSYDAALDAAVAFFADKYDDAEVMQKAAELMFRRNRKGLTVHDLAWGFYKTANPNALSYVARHLTSDNPSDVELTVKLMGFDDPGTKSGRRALYDEYTKWLSENKKYLYTTNEHFSSTSKPYSVRHDREAKFLDCEIDPRERAPKKPLTDAERAMLNAYRFEKGDV